jgi:hypothetical protein
MLPCHDRQGSHGMYKAAALDSRGITAMHRASICIQ